LQSTIPTIVEAQDIVVVSWDRTPQVNEGLQRSECEIPNEEYPTSERMQSRKNVETNEALCMAKNKTRKINKALPASLPYTIMGVLGACKHSARKTKANKETGTKLYGKARKKAPTSQPTMPIGCPIDAKRMCQR
jgi:hypothetical protein